MIIKQEQELKEFLGIKDTKVIKGDSIVFTLPHTFDIAYGDVIEVNDQFAVIQDVKGIKWKLQKGERWMNSQDVNKLLQSKGNKF